MGALVSPVDRKPSYRIIIGALVSLVDRKCSYRTLMGAFGSPVDKKSINKQDFTKINIFFTDH